MALSVGEWGDNTAGQPKHRATAPRMIPPAPKRASAIALPWLSISQEC